MRIVLIVAAATLSLAACSQQTGENAAATADSAGDTVASAASDTAANADAAAEGAVAVTSDAAANVDAAAGAAARKTEAAVDAAENTK